MPTTDPASEAPSGLVDPLLGEYVPHAAVALTDAERWPSLDAAGLARVEAARTHPRAPTWGHATGDRLDADDLGALAARVPPSPGDRPGAVPGWVAELVDRVHRTVPRYRAAARQGRSGPASALTDLPTLSRADLADVASLVPVDVQLDRVLEGSSSGSTGTARVVPLHPRAVAADLLLVHALVFGAGARWDADPDRLGLANVVDQRTAFTYVSAMTAFPRPAGAPAPLMARVNLDPSAWRRTGDREAWFAAHDPQLVSTTTLPLLRLLDLADDVAGQTLSLHPVAVLTGATHVTPAVRERVRDRWEVPLVDLYALRETGPVAACADGRGHVVVTDRRLHVEVLDELGEPVADGVRGEVVVTVDENPYLPLLRYRTGDHAALVHDGRGAVLVDLEGRDPVLFVARGGRRLPAVDAVQVLQAAGLTAWRLHQDAGGDVRLDAVAGAGRAAEAARAVRDWLDRPVELTVLDDAAALGPGKPRRFGSDLA